MRVREFGGPETLRAEEVDDPQPLPTEVAVRVAAAGVNPVDCKTRAGSGMAHVVGTPWIPGWDVAGAVDEVGAGVTRFQPGDAVVGMPWFPRPAGAYAERVTAPSRQFAPAPATLPLSEAAGMPLAGLTAWHALVDLAGVGHGQRVLVTAGAGGVGHLAVQIAAARGATVVATARAANHGFLRGLGAAEVIDYTQELVVKAVSTVDVALHLAGAEPVTLLEAVRPGGWLVRVTGVDDAAARQAAADRGVHSPRLLVEPDGTTLERLVALVDADQLQVTVSDELALADAAEAHRRAEVGGTRGKRVLRVA